VDCLTLVLSSSFFILVSQNIKIRWSSIPCHPCCLDFLSLVWPSSFFDFLSLASHYSLLDLLSLLLPSVFFGFIHLFGFVSRISLF